MTLDDLISLEEAAEHVGRSQIALRKAAQRGSLEAKRVGKVWITTHEFVAIYVARVAAQRRVRRPESMPGHAVPDQRHA